MTSKLTAWISAARPRTLPLSVSGIITASAAANLNGIFVLNIFLLALATTLGLQILSNFANDYGDSVKGTDNHERVGPMRAVQSGVLSPQEMKKGIIICALITLMLAAWLIYITFKNENLLHSTVFLVLGALSIVAAITYTVGRFAYGYRALGDLFVFIFFGLLSVLGTYFLYAKQLDSFIVLPAFVIGFLSTAVLNLNNMRDRIADERANKITLAVLMGEKRIKRYHYFLIIGSFAISILYFVLVKHSFLVFLPLLGFVPLLKHVLVVKNNKSAVLLDPELKKVALSTFVFSIIFFAVSFF